MIKITYTKNSISLTGHACQAPKGKDIVCAGISAIFFGSLSWFKAEDITLVYNKKVNGVKLELVNKSKQNQAYIALIVKQLTPMAYDFKKYIKLSKGK
ncbi:MAG: ribosomal-processing cysteine protease Prp [Mycoplasmoidaceae bacterium]|nr:ribosomal-processing cysteine protease Prp [Mycoplasmoidaceae bacterium]